MSKSLGMQMVNYSHTLLLSSGWIVSADYQHKYKDHTLSTSVTKSFWGDKFKFTTVWWTDMDLNSNFNFKLHHQLAPKLGTDFSYDVGSREFSTGLSYNPGKYSI